jgi:phosphatidylglycerol:prolipoprotein diacylglycerol transferase
MLRISEISFPGFGIGNFEVDSVAFSIGSFTIAWYALIITLGMICAVAYTMFRARGIGLKNDDIIDYALALIPTGIIGARLYYVLAEIDNYHSFKDVINIRNGGLAIYGGIIGGFIAAVIVSKIKKIPFPAFADCCVPGIILAQSIGRWGNFMNGEAYGGKTDIFIRMGLKNGNTIADFGTGEMVYVHPTFLYESLWNLLGFVLINIFYKHKKYDGQILFLVFGWYGLGRMLIEGLRTDSLYTNIFGLKFRTSLVLGGLIFAVCLGFLIYFAIKKPTKENYIKKTTEK